MCPPGRWRRAPQLKTVKKALDRFVTDKSHGSRGRARFFDVFREARERLAEIMQVAPSDIGFLGSCSDAINLVCWSLPWEQGDNVVVNDLDYPSMIYPFARLESRYGVEVRVVKSRNFDLSTSDFAEAIDSHTRLVPVSHVSYLTGLRHDIHAIAEVAHRSGAAVLTDISHSLGVVPLDLSGIDFAVSCAYKWLLGIHGLGIFHWTDAFSHTSTPCSSGRPPLRKIRPFLIRPGSLPATTPAGSRLEIRPGSVFTPLSTDSATSRHWAANRCTIMSSAWPPWFGGASRNLVSM